MGVDAPLVEGDGAVQPGAQARLEPVELVGGEADRGLAALERLVVVVGREEDLGGVVRRPARPGSGRSRREVKGSRKGMRKSRCGAMPLDVAGVAAGPLGDAGAR